MIKRLEKLLLIPLALFLTGCPEKFEVKDLEVDRIVRIKCEIKSYIFPEEGKRWDTTFLVWYNISNEEPDYKHWYSRRKSYMRASKDCDRFLKYTEFPK